MAADRTPDDLVGRQPLALDLPPHAASPGVARAWLRTIADTTALPAAMVSDATLVLSELVTNAVLHAATDVHVSMELRDDTAIHLEVGDATSALPHVLVCDPEHIGGAGLRIVDQLVVSWGVRRVGAGKVVWADLGVAVAGP
jgi:anti-sigma regulatory factor (Ser/Thr protein kinase)